MVRRCEMVLLLFSYYSLKPVLQPSKLSAAAGRKLRTVGSPQPVTDAAQQYATVGGLLRRNVGLETVCWGDNPALMSFSRVRRDDAGDPAAVDFT